MARNFDGMDDFIELGDTASYWNFMHDTSGLFTVSFWYKFTTSEPGTVTIFLSDMAGATGNIGIGITFEDRASEGADHSLRFSIHRGTGGQVVISFLSGLFFPKDTNYHHLAITWDQGLGSNNMSAFIDGGSEINATKTANAPTDSNSTNEMHIGAGGTEGNTFDGPIYHLAIWNSVLTDSQIVALSNGANPISFDVGNLKGFYPLYGNQDPEPNFEDQLHTGEVTGAIKEINPPVELVENYL